MNDDQQPGIWQSPWECLMVFLGGCLVAAILVAIFLLFATSFFGALR